MPSPSYAFSQFHEKNEMKLYKAIENKKFEKALLYFNEIHKTIPLSNKDEQVLAFLYAQNGNAVKALKIIENLLEKDIQNKELLYLALEYSMAQKNWDKAIFYNDRLLTFNPSDENLLKNQAYFYLIEKNSNLAIKSYENLIKNYPKLEYKLELFNLYMDAKDFSEAQEIIEPIYTKNTKNKKIVNMYMNSLLAQNKLDDAYRLVKKHCLGNTKEGSVIIADTAMRDNDYNSAIKYYLKAVNFDQENNDLKIKLAQSYRMIKNPEAAAQVYYNILSKDSCNKDALLGLGYLKIDGKFYPQARKVFKDILMQDPDYLPAKMGMLHSYTNNGDNLNALKILKQIPDTDNIKLLRANTYYRMGMPSNAKQTLNGVVTKDAEDLKYRIRHDEAITITPSYIFVNQVLEEEFDLDYDKFGINVSQGIPNNLNIFADCNVYSYDSGKLFVEQRNHNAELSNVTGEVKLGVIGRPVEKYEFRTDLGAKIYQFNQGYMLNTNSWIKRYFNDKFNLKLGFYRDNLEQTYLSAVGLKVNGIFTGQVANNKIHLDYEYKFPKQFYSFGSIAWGEMTGQNLQSNPYMDSILGLGRLMYNNPNNKWLNTVNFDLESHTEGFKYHDLLIIHGNSTIYGGYYCPNYFINNTAGLKFEGNIKKINMKYGFKFAGGYQYNPEQSQIPAFSKASFLFWPYLTWNPNDNISMNLSYTYSNVILVRHAIAFNIVFKVFKARPKQNRQISTRKKSLLRFSPLFKNPNGF